MLDRSKIISQITATIGTLLIDLEPEQTIAYTVWDFLVKNPQLLALLQESSKKWPMPLWLEPLETVKHCKKTTRSYRVIALDGSQVYPDKHQGFICYLINIGTVELSYGLANTSKPVVINTTPYLFSGHNEEENLSADLVDSKRTELELAHAVTLAKTYQNSNSTLLLFDGSLVFWHLEAKTQELKERFLERYLELFEQLYKLRMPYVGYISLPKSKELINIVRNAQQNPVIRKQLLIQEKTIEHLVDTDLAGFFLSPGARSGLYTATASIIEQYPQYLKPCFVYLDTGYEIARIEIPAWIAKNREQVDGLCAIIIDQAAKGQGYPIALAEAHEAAVIRGADRDFFYQLLYRVAQSNKQQILTSRKSLKKRSVGV